MGEFAAWKIKRRFYRGCLYCCVWLVITVCMQVWKVQWFAPLCVLIAVLCFVTLAALVAGVIASIIVLMNEFGKKSIELSSTQAGRIPFSNDIIAKDKERVQKRGGIVVVQKIPFVGKCVVEVKR